MLIKCKSTDKGFAACYIYRSSFGDQRISVKYAEDVSAIDLLIANHMERQAVMLLGAHKDNKLRDYYSK